ncbi:MAG: serine/threonine-protein kinase [Anaerolineaceae bacterium]
MPFKEGETVGPYQILAQLGQGGMATVYKAYHEALDRYVALKVLHPAFTDDATFMTRFQREARVVARLDHPNIVPIYDFAEYEGRPYLVMKFIEGETLKALLARGRLSLQQIVPIVEAVGAALAYAHQQNVVHRDVKPSNILISKDGKIYLTDFGLARMAQTSTSLTADQLVGTPQYISPEQAMSKPDLDYRSDIYSFAVVVYEMVVGRVPYDADTPFSIVHDHIYTPLPLPRQVNPDVPEAVEAVLIKALAKNPDDRYADVTSFVEAFKEAVQTGTSAAKPSAQSAGTDYATQKQPEPSSVVIGSQNATVPQPFAGSTITAVGKSLPIAQKVKNIGQKTVAKSKSNETACLVAIIIVLVLCCVGGPIAFLVNRKNNAKATVTATSVILATTNATSIVSPSVVVTPLAMTVAPTGTANVAPLPDIVSAVAAWKQSNIAQTQIDINAFEKNAGSNAADYRAAFQYLQDQKAWLVAAMTIFNSLHPLGGEIRLGFPENVREVLYLAAMDPLGDSFFNSYGGETPFTAATLRHQLYFNDVNQMEKMLEKLLADATVVQRFPELKLLEVELYVKQGDLNDAKIKYDQLNLQSLPAWIQKIAVQVSEQIH